MEKYYTLTLVSFGTALITLGYAINGSQSDLSILSWYLTIAFSILFICFLIIGIAKKISSKISPYKVFAISDFIIGIIALLYAIYDIAISTDIWAGFIGVILLLTVIPVILVLLLIDLFVWLYNRKKEKKHEEK